MIDRLFKILFSLPLLFTVSCVKQRGSNMELNIHVPDIKIQIDPQKMEDAFSMMIALQLFRGLLRYDQNGDVMSDIAESWTESADHLRYTFKLKPMTFSDGKPITSRHVQMTLARLFFLGSSMAADIDSISGVDEFKKNWDISKFGVKPIGDRELEIRLTHPSAIFLKQIAVVDCSILPLEDFKQNLDLSHKGAFSGPYKLAAQEGMQFKLEKWRPDKLDSSRPPQTINFFATKELPATLAKAGKTDSLDTDRVQTDDERTLRKSGWASRPTELTYESFVILNPKYVPVDVRRALYDKLDPVEVVKFLGEPNLIPAFGLIPNGFYGFVESKPKIEKDHAPYKGKKISFKLDYLANAEFDKKLAVYLREKWTSENIEVVLNEVPRGEKLTRMFSKTAEATVGRKGTDYPDGYSVLTYFKGKYESNYFHVDDPKIDAMIAKASQEFDQGKRAKLYQEIQVAILGHYTNIPLYFGSTASGLWSDKVESIPAHPLGFHTMPYETVLMRSL
jgi:oligopeptide transport system substrate-binding protein